jgi:hypothetical protein
VASCEARARTQLRTASSTTLSLAQAPYFSSRARAAFVCQPEGSVDCELLSGGSSIRTNASKRRALPGPMPGITLHHRPPRLMQACKSARVVIPDWRNASVSAGVIHSPSRSVRWAS